MVASQTINISQWSVYKTQTCKTAKINTKQKQKYTQNQLTPTSTPVMTIKQKNRNHIWYVRKFKNDLEWVWNSKYMELRNKAEQERKRGERLKKMKEWGGALGAPNVLWQI